MTTAQEGPEAGHTFRISYTSRGSYSVVGEPGYKDSDWFHDELHTVEVRAWNLRDALRKAADLPFEELMGEGARLASGLPISELNRLARGDLQARVEAVLKLISPDHITPIGKRRIEQALRGD